MVAEAGALRTNTGNDYRYDSGASECGSVNTGEFGVRPISAVLVAMFGPYAITTPMMLQPNSRLWPR